MMDGNRRLVDVAQLFAKLDIVQGFDFKRGRFLVVSIAVQLVGILVECLLRVELVALGLLGNILQQADVANLFEPLGQQYVL